MMNTALQTAKELGSSVITPEHIILSILKNRRGLAYDIIKAIGVNENKLADDILKPIDEKQINNNIVRDIKLITNFVNELNLDNDLFKKEV